MSTAMNDVMIDAGIPAALVATLVNQMGMAMSSSGATRIASDIYDLALFFGPGDHPSSALIEDGLSNLSHGRWLKARGKVLTRAGGWTLAAAATIAASYYAASKAICDANPEYEQ